MVIKLCFSSFISGQHLTAFKYATSENRCSEGSEQFQSQLLRYYKDRFEKLKQFFAEFDNPDGNQTCDSTIMLEWGEFNKSKELFQLKQE